MNSDEVIKLLVSGGVAVLRTDTLYGIVGRADSQDTVRRIHQIKERSPGKALIVLIAKPADAYGGNSVIEDHSDGGSATSVIVPSPNAPDWLRQDDGTVAYRVPVSTELRQLLASTGPLVAPSANPESRAPAQTIDEAKAYFGDAIDMYIDGGEVPADTPASKIIRLHEDGAIERLR